MTELCPTCGGTLKPKQIRVCLNTNTLIADGHAIKLSLMQAEIAHCLANCSPRPLAHERLYHQVYGWAVPERVRASMQVHICMLRRKLRPVGFDVQLERGVGYALRRLEGNAVAA